MFEKSLNFSAYSTCIQDQKTFSKNYNIAKDRMGNKKD